MFKDENFKCSYMKDRASFYSPLMKEILYSILEWGKKNGIKIVFTETITTENEDKKTRRVSTTHQEGRAVDVRCFDWEETKINDLWLFLRVKYGAYGAVSKNTGRPNIVLIHDTGLGKHFHIQVNRKYKIKTNIETYESNENV